MTVSDVYKEGFHFYNFEGRPVNRRNIWRKFNCYADDVIMIYSLDSKEGLYRVENLTRSFFPDILFNYNLIPFIVFPTII